MSYQNYVIAAYGVFALVLLWDFIATHARIRRLRRAAARQAARRTTGVVPGAGGELRR